MKATDIKEVAIIGSGAMGVGTAALFAMRGYKTNFYGRNQDKVDEGMTLIHAALQEFADQEFFPESQIKPLMSNIAPTIRLEQAAQGAQLVLESIEEKLETKHLIFGELDRFCRSDAIFATNTSALPITRVAEAVTFPQRFVGMHFFNPAYLIRSVEVIPGEHTSEQTMATVCDLLHSIGKIPSALRKDAKGFVANRLQIALAREIAHIIQEGVATAEAIDQIVSHALADRWKVAGPCATMAMGGPHVFKAIAQVVVPDLSVDPGVPHMLRLATNEDRGAAALPLLYPGTLEDLADLKTRRRRELFATLRRSELAETSLPVRANPEPPCPATTLAL